MRTLSIDIETFSSINLAKSGVYRYAEAPDFEILLFGYSADGGPVQVIDLATGEKMPQEIRKALTNPTVTKWAFNAQFERVCLSNYLDTWLSPDSWHCTMVWSATLGLPLSLEGVGAVLGLEKQKLTEGKNLIKYFCVPCAPTKINGGRTRNLPQHDMEKWEQFKAYTIPVTPHLLYPQFMDDENQKERADVMHFNYVLLGKCNELWVFGDEISKGMAHEIGIAKKRQQTIRWFNRNCKEVTRVLFQESIRISQRQERTLRWK